MERRLSDILANSWLGHISKGVTSAFEFILLAYYKKYAQGSCAVRSLRKIWGRERVVLFSPGELWMLRELARVQSQHGGSFAEIGVFRGVSAEVICQAKLASTEFLLFDTFEGLPIPGKLDPRFRKGMFSASEEVVYARLKQYSKWSVYKGLFPGSAAPAEHKRFSFVHLDVDLYGSTLAGLEFFWPRMLEGGILISHDYSQCEGVCQAFNEFFLHRIGFRLIELPTTQVMVIKDWENPGGRGCHPLEGPYQLPTDDPRENDRAKEVPEEYSGGRLWLPPACESSSMARLRISSGRTSSDPRIVPPC